MFPPISSAVRVPLTHRVFKRISRATHLSHRAFCLLLVISSHSFAELPLRVVEEAETPTGKSELLRRIEQHQLPEVIVEGPAGHESLPAYYWENNRQLHQRLLRARTRYASDDQNPFRRVTLISGTAGIGKTYIKQEIAAKGLPKNAVLRFDIKDLYGAWESEQRTCPRADLRVGPHVLNSMLAACGPERTPLKDYLDRHEAAFYIIDSLEEIHPDDYEHVLRQVEQFALDGDRDFVHVVVLGRPVAFHDYLRSVHPRRSPDEVALFHLAAPKLRTTGDLRVSSWNYHHWRFKLRWSPNGEQYESIPLDHYHRWHAEGFPRTGMFRSVSFTPNDQLHCDVEDTLRRWAVRHRYANSMLRNLAGNGILREIAAARVAKGLAYDEAEIKLAYLESWLRREAESEGRPSPDRPEDLRVYLGVLSEIANHYASANRLDAAGRFVVQDGDTVETHVGGKSYSISVADALDRSGLAVLLSGTKAAARYRFEPLWMHRLLVETEPIADDFGA